MVASCVLCLCFNISSTKFHILVLASYHSSYTSQDYNITFLHILCSSISFDKNCPPLATNPPIILAIAFPMVVPPLPSLFMFLMSSSSSKVIGTLMPTFITLENLSLNVSELQLLFVLPYNTSSDPT